MKQNDRKYITWSISAHAVILLLLMLNFYFATPTPVLQNTHQNDVISAVVLGDSAKSKILPQQLPPPKPPLEPIKEEIKEVKEEVKKEEIKPVVKEAIKPLPAKPKPIEQAKVEPDAIAIKKADDKKKLAAQKALEEKKRLAKLTKEKLAKDLLADMEKVTKNVKKLEVKKPISKPQPQFDKILREQAEKSLRQQLLDEEIKLQGQQARESQGEVNKYKALIIQAISEHWIVPPQADKKLYCELMIRLAPGGMVLDVKITKSSGDVALDGSARAAVLKASPLPVPKDSHAFDAFRQFALKVKPENIIQT